MQELLATIYSNMGQKAKSLEILENLRQTLHEKPEMDYFKLVRNYCYTANILFSMGHS